MPRINPDRNTARERLVARRVRQEREALGWKLENLAHAVTGAGCPLDRAAVYKIEAGERRISVDELFAFASVFKKSADALAGPPGREAAGLVSAYQRKRASWESLGDEIRRLESRILDLVDDGYEAEVLEVLRQGGAGDVALDLMRVTHSRGSEALHAKTSRWRVEGDDVVLDDDPDVD